MSETTEYTKPIPRGEGFHGEFYAHCKEHKLHFQRCSKCGSWQHMPRECCRACGSFDWTFEPSTGKGKIFTWSIIHRALHAGFKEEVPYASVVVEMDEGVRLPTRVVDIALDDLKVGMPVEVVFEDVTPELTVHAFRPAAG
jgi:hypothetical protein